MVRGPSPDPGRTQSGPSPDPVRTQQNAGRVLGVVACDCLSNIGTVSGGVFSGVISGWFGGCFRGGFGVGFRGRFGGRFRAGLCRPSARQKAERRRGIGCGSGGAACSFFS